ncbi:Mhf1p SCDLUD_005120 [Saccharomycodes ludwigii]|uniref:Mhf1p n=1 Tax=Saccharomycodes ludwigii TaxID=36035 RepID=UPI001E845441|nr:hypothetical protein SCDLUD_005120 [Saccharomycodes ludwigii]KAH3898785.1 hypothetical protein SCDLUD_005120 [Saccharomycodes ludwigii]
MNTLTSNNHPDDIKKLVWCIVKQQIQEINTTNKNTAQYVITESFINQLYELTLYRLTSLITDLDDFRKHRNGTTIELKDLQLYFRNNKQLYSVI